MSASPDHKARAHSVLGASVAHRWMACPGSIRLCSGIPNPETIYAAEGTAAHELAEICLKGTNGFRFADAADFIGEEITVGNHKFTVDEEMAEAVQLYVDTVKADYDDKDILLIEHRFDLSGTVYDGMFGTNDCGLYKISTGKLIIYDYKHGKGHAVEAKDNPQLKYYGIGAMSLPSLKGISLDEIELVIVQPRAPHRDGPVRRWQTDVTHLIDFIADLRDAAVQTTVLDAPVVAGAHCKFCPAAGVCPALREKALEDAQAEFGGTPSDLTEAQIADLLSKADLIEDWLKAIRSEAYGRAEGGAKIPGYKLVQKRAVRKWSGDADTVATELCAKFDLGLDDVLERKLRSPAQVEKLLPKADRAGLAELITAESSGTTLARETDRRAEVAPARRAADDFDPVGD